MLVRASDALPLAASVDDEEVRVHAARKLDTRLDCVQTEQKLQEHKQQAKLIFRRITPNSEPRCSIESGQYTLQYVTPLPSSPIRLKVAHQQLLHSQ
jgi:vesicle transport protein SEC22